jgi:hypothetical protein
MLISAVNVRKVPDRRTLHTEIIKKTPGYSSGTLNSLVSVIDQTGRYRLSKTIVHTEQDLLRVALQVDGTASSTDTSEDRGPRGCVTFLQSDSSHPTVSRCDVRRRVMLR